MGFISQEYSFNASMEDGLFVKSLKQHSFANYTLKQREQKEKSRLERDWSFCRGCRHQLPCWTMGVVRFNRGHFFKIHTHLKGSKFMCSALNFVQRQFGEGSKRRIKFENWWKWRSSDIIGLVGLHSMSSTNQKRSKVTIWCANSKL